MAVFWRKQMSVGNQWLDNDHRHLICLINTVEMTLRSPEHRDLLAEALDELQRYTREHFKREEEIQFKIRFPGFSEHKIEHQNLLAKFEEIRGRLLEACAGATGPAHQAPGSAPEAGRAPVQEQADPEDLEAEIAVLVVDPPPAPLADQDVDALVELLREWLIQHVLGADVKMKRYLSQYPATLF